MRRWVTALGVSVVLLAVAAACSPAPPPTGDAASPEPTDAPVVAFEARFTCGEPFTFGPELLDRPGGDERAATPLAAALRAKVGRPDPDTDGILPKGGWVLVGQRGPVAQYLAPDGAGGAHEVSLQLRDSEWRVVGWGFCQPERVMPPGLNLASWDLEPGQDLGPVTTSFIALVTERECASGQSSEGRVVQPDIVVSRDRVLVTFAVRALPGGMHTCPGNPATRVHVDLPEPLNGRDLLDGSLLPARDPRPVECCG